MSVDISPKNVRKWFSDIFRGYTEADSGGGARGAHPLFFAITFAFVFVFVFFAITLKNCKLCSSLINACKSLIMYH